MGIASSWGLIHNNGRFLFIRRSERTSRPGEWCPPGGRRASDESGEEACIRAVMEDVKLPVKVDKLISEELGNYFYLCSLDTTSDEPQLSEEAANAFHWIEPRALIGLGSIMELKQMKRVFDKLGYEIEFPPCMH